jgi:preprotein translocase subunit SecY
MLASLTNIVRIPELRKKLLFTFGLLVVYRLGFHIFIPGVDTIAVKKMIEQAAQQGGLGQLLAFAGAITGGALTEAAVFSLGIMPYISASIIFSLLVKVIPTLEALSKEGEAGRKRINQYTRYATVALCLIQSMFVVAYLRGGGQGGMSLILPQYRDYWFFYVSTVVSLTTGTIFLMWLGEMITEFGIGNGISLIIMSGIIARMPFALGQFIETEIIRQATGPDASRLGVTLGVGKFILFAGLFVAVIAAVVAMQQSQRRIPIQQAKHTRGRRVYGGQRHYLPFRINAAGVMPVIFANSLLILPIALLQYVGVEVGSGLRSERGFWYMTLTIGLIYFFTYFWTSLQFNPVEMAHNMKEYGSFIPGIRPGRKTAEYLEEIMNRITLVGASFLAAITIFPTIIMHVTDLDYYLANFLGGTGILIVVGVALDIVQKVESHLLMRHYEGFIKRGKIKGRRG